MKETTLTKTAVLAIFVILLAFVPNVYAKSKTETGVEQQFFISTGEGEKVALFRGGKSTTFWQDVKDVVPISYYEDFGASLSWSIIEEEIDAIWITYDFVVDAPSDNGWYIYEKTFDIDGEIVSAQMTITADNAYMVHINGRLIGRDGNLFQPTPEVDLLNWMTPETYDVTKALKEGSNRVVVYVRNYGIEGLDWYQNPTGLIFSIEGTYLAQ